MIAPTDNRITLTVYGVILAPLLILAAGCGEESSPMSTNVVVRALPLEPADLDRLVLSLGGGVEMELVRIRAGTFMMGSPANETGRGDDEILAQASIARDFYIGETELTQAQWKAVIGATPWATQNYVQEGDRYPASCVSWHKAQIFTKKLSEISGRVVRLPTTAEWEYACRAGTTTAYSFGNTDHGMGDYAWYGGFRGDGNITDDKFAHAVKSKKPNQWGLYDMHGNVWEWCENRHESNASRVVRGGAWNDSPADCRSAYRGWVPSTEGYGHGGFRVVVDISSTQK